MTIKFVGKRVIFECDSCNETIESNEKETFDEFSARRKQAGWTVSRVGRTDQWTHGCPKHSA